MKPTLKTVFLLAVVQFFFIKGMEEKKLIKPLDELQSELDIKRAEIRDLLLGLEAINFEVLGRESNITRGYQARMKCAYENNDKDALVVLKKQVSRRLKALTSEHENFVSAIIYQKADSHEDTLLRWNYIKKYIEDNKSKLRLREEADWMSQLESIKKDLRIYCLDSKKFNIKLDRLIKDFDKSLVTTDCKI